MFDTRAPEIGPPELTVFVGVEHDEQGRGCACFVTRDADSFALCAPELELRIELLRRLGVEHTEERRALQALVSGA